MVGVAEVTKVTAEQALKLGRLIESGQISAEMLAHLMDMDDNPILTRIYEGVEIEATTGYETIARSPDVFSGFLDGDFERWGTDQRGTATAPAKVDVWEMDPAKCEEATFAEIFGALGNPNLAQGQIIDFCKRHRDLLRQDGWATFFPFKVGEERFVAYVCVGGGALVAGVYRFDDGRRWGADYRFRVVAPQR